MKIKRRFKVSPLPYLKVFECQESIQSVDSVFSKTSFPETYGPSPSPPSPQQNEKRILRPNRKFSCLILYFNLAIVYHIAFINCATSWKTNRAYILNPLRPAHQVKVQSRVCHATTCAFSFFFFFFTDFKVLIEPNLLRILAQSLN